MSAATKQTMVRGGMMEAEARNILNVKPKAAEAEIQEVRMHAGLSGFWARTPAQPRSTERGRESSRGSLRTPHSPRSLLPALRCSASSTRHTTPAARAVHGRAEPRALPTATHSRRIARCNLRGRGRCGSAATYPETVVPAGRRARVACGRPITSILPSTILHTTNTALSYYQC